ncbi:MAG TPA: hypothetical protein VFQ90_19285 [Stellaceae bacterium]|jgi:hypothetical protein|nr:hypothetical protein [Stellaceae bacterium]
MVTFGPKPSYQDYGREFDYAPSGDGRALTIAFSADGPLQAQIVDDGDPAISSAAFSLAVPLEGSTGEKVEIEFSLTGLAKTSGGGTATMMLSVSGQSIVVDFPTDTDQDLIDQKRVVTFTAENGASECRVSVFLLVGRDSPSGSAFLNASTIEAEFLPRPA